MPSSPNSLLSLTSPIPFRRRKSCGDGITGEEDRGAMIVTCWRIVSCWDACPFAEGVTRRPGTPKHPQGLGSAGVPSADGQATSAAETGGVPQRVHVAAERRRPRRLARWRLAAALRGGESAAREVGIGRPGGTTRRPPLTGGVADSGQDARSPIARSWQAAARSALSGGEGIAPLPNRQTSGSCLRRRWRSGPLPGSFSDR
jgi:hypothetical protein